jgi:ATP-dependent exoDNAse (exonuclease V) beta subunit
MSEPLKDQQARDRFRAEWNRNFAVSANAGSGKTTAISERLAEMALSIEGAALLPKTAVVTFTKKSAAQIGQRARQVLMRRLETGGAVDLKALDHLERAFFGTIHSFCLLLAQRYGQKFGLNLNPRLLVENEDDEDAFWEEFLEQDAMQFTSLTAAELDAFLRFVALDDVFVIARGLNAATAKNLACRRPAGLLPAPSEAVLQQILALPVKGTPKSRENTETNKRAAAAWMERFVAGRGFLPLYEPAGKAKEICELAKAWMAPLKAWLADAAAVLAAELAGRYREYRFERGVQTYADQIDAVMAVLQDAETLDKLRGDGWRVILDEAQDTDSQQFAVLVEIARPPGAQAGSWPQGNGVPPRAGCFCMVGDAQQAIYRSRADVRNFTRHLDAFGRGDGGELLVFEVTFRTPSAVVELLNASFPAAFGPGREHNLGLAPAEGVSAPLLQVRYEPLVSGPRNEAGAAEIFPLTIPAVPPESVAGWLAEEARQLAEFLCAHGPTSVGAECWGEVCVLAPRVDWLTIAQKAFNKAGLKTALQIRRNRNGDNPPYAWLTGLLAVICDPRNAFEWFGVLREIFAVSDDLLAVELGERGEFLWETPEVHPEPLRSALAVLRPWILRVDDEGVPLGEFIVGLIDDCALAAKAKALDAAGGLGEELVRLLAEATQLGLEGAGPRQWLCKLLAGIDQERPSGKPDYDAINLLSSHSAKGLEWPVVIPLGFWRPIGEMPQRGLYLISDGRMDGQTRVYFDQGSLPLETGEARTRERVRELVRLLYVTLTRASRRLVLPWSTGFGGGRRSGPSFAELFGAAELIAALPKAEGGTLISRGRPTPKLKSAPKVEAAGWLASLPRRILPHQLAQKPDLSRGLRHESSIDQSVPVKLSAGDEAIEYGVWWHETMEHMPWHGTEQEVTDHIECSLAIAAGQGMSIRAKNELACLRNSQAWKALTAERWTLVTELAIFSPLETGTWIDGVMDLVMHDLVKGELWVVDWKTNQRAPGEVDRALLARLAGEYAPQLWAYGRSLQGLFSGHTVRLLVYSSILGEWIDVIDSSENPLYSQTKAPQVDPSK